MLNRPRSKSNEHRIEGYEVEDLICSGGFSDVFKAIQVKNQILVAMKILNEAGCRIAALMEKHHSTVWEGPLMKRLDHPNIARCIDFSKKGRPYWIALEYLERKASDYVGQCNNKEEENRMIILLSEVISAVSYLHERGYIHRDLCMDNILVDRAGTAKLIDFGLTIPTDSSVVKGRAGTPSYMAPEMIRSWTHTELTDIYSFGVVMYELITARKPFWGKWKEERMTRSLNLIPLMPSQLGRYCSPELEELLQSCLEKDPSKRIQSAREIDNTLFLLRLKRGLT
jgi:serine/threonine protein kinase